MSEMTGNINNSAKPVNLDLFLPATLKGLNLK